MARDLRAIGLLLMLVACGEHGEPLITAKVAAHADDIDRVAAASAVPDAGIQCVEPVASAEWTVLVYMMADNNLEQDSARDLYEMTQADLPPSIHVVVEWDRAGSTVFLVDGTEVDRWSEGLRIHVTKDAPIAKSAAILNLGEINTGDPEVLSDFIAWAKVCYPARHTALVMWNHGQGWRNMMTAAADAVAEWRGRVTLGRLRDGVAKLGLVEENGGGASWLSVEPPGARPETSNYKSMAVDEDIDGDDKPDRDTLYNKEIEDVLRRQHVDLLGFDSCLMGMVETAYAMRGGADVLVASPDLVPGVGWQYTDLLNRLSRNPTLSPRDLATAIVDSYAKMVVSANTTLAASDLTRADELARDVSALADALRTEMATRPAVRAMLRKVRGKLPVFASDRHNRRTGLPSHQHVDLGLLAARLDVSSSPDEIRLAARRLQQEIAAMVFRNHARKDREWSTGLAIYFPENAQAYATDEWEEGAYRRGNDVFPVDFVNDTAWSDLLVDYLK